MIGSIDPYKYQNYQAGNNALNFGSLTGSSRGIESNRFNGNSNAAVSRPTNDMSFVNRLDKMDPKAPEQRDAMHGKKLYLMG